MIKPLNRSLKSCSVVSGPRLPTYKRRLGVSLRSPIFDKHLTYFPSLKLRPSSSCGAAGVTTLLSSIYEVCARVGAEAGWLSALASGAKRTVLAILLFDPWCGLASEDLRTVSVTGGDLRMVLATDEESRTVSATGESGVMSSGPEGMLLVICRSSSKGGAAPTVEVTALCSGPM